MRLLAVPGASIGTSQAFNSLNEAFVGVGVIVGVRVSVWVGGLLWAHSAPIIRTAPMRLQSRGAIAKCYHSGEHEKP